jgi:hypothetical protein
MPAELSQDFLKTFLKISRWLFEDGIVIERGEGTSRQLAPELDIPWSFSCPW